MVEVESVRKYFLNIEALKGISFIAYPGKILGLLGPNGAGKTTTIRILSTIIKPDRGRARVNNFDLIREPEKVRASLGVLFENTGLYRRLTGEENILYFAELYGIKKSEAKERMRELFNIIEVDYANRPAGEYSKGMTQKIVLIRAVIGDPPVILLDEPTVGLDVPATISVRSFLSHMKAQDKTIILSTHLMNEVEMLCDDVVVIDHGILVGTGTPEEIREKNNAKNLEEAFLRMVKR